MKIILFSILAFVLSSNVQSQVIKKIKADSVRIYNDSMNAELIITNHTKDVSGFLYNTGNGRTSFKKIVEKITDSSVHFRGADSIRIPIKGLPGGLNGAVQYNHSTSFAGNDSSLYWSDSTKRFEIGGNQPESDFGIESKNLGENYSETDGITLLNNTAAATGAQQRSPGIRFEGRGIAGTSTSRPMEVNHFILPVQGSSSPTFQLAWEYQRNNAMPRFRSMIAGNGITVVGGGLSFCETVPTKAGDIIGSDQVNIYLSETPTSTPLGFLAYPNSTVTSGNGRFVYLSNGSVGFNPSSGNATHTMVSVEGKFNQSGSANGVTRGMHLRPDLVSAADFRAIEIEEGKSHFRTLSLTSAGDKINIATGANASTGAATLASGTVTINTTAVTSGSKIFLTYITPSGTTGQLSAPSGSISSGTSFVINSTSGSDNSTVYYWIVN